MPMLKQLKPLFFPIEKVLNSDYFGTETQFNPSLTHSIIAKTPTGDLVVNACSKNYSLMSNEDLIMPLVERLQDKYTVEAKVSQFNFSKFYIDLVIKDIEMKVQKKDSIFPRIRMNNSYDGSVKYQFGFGFYRLVCENGMTAPVNGMQSKIIKLRHTPSNGANAIEKTLQAIDQFLIEVPKIIKGYDDLIKRKLTMAEATILMNDILEDTKFPKKKEEEILAQLEKEKSMGFPVSDWLIYNAFNHVLYNNDSRMKTHKKDKVDAQVLNYISNR